MRLVQIGERLFEFIGTDPIDVEIHPFVEGFVQVAPNTVDAGFVQLPWIRDQAYCLLQHLDTHRQFGRRGRQLFLDTGTGSLDLAELRLDLVSRHSVVRRQIDESFFLALQILEALLQRGMHLLYTGSFVSQDSIEHRGCVHDEVRR
ncbi:hypothetical protein [Nocardia aurea]|uniref:hypothetical protein n=1 Tax=Nocardia aurea TaxID=2144174 RepID=UPI001E37480B|nr:hypothetical protein [Nocardia aurea]